MLCTRRFGGDACSGVCFAACVSGVHGSELVDCVHYIGIDGWMTACMSLEVF